MEALAHSRTAGRIDWPVAIFLGVVHALCVACFFVAPTVEALVLFGVWFVLTGFGITIGYHRFFSHRSFECGIWQTRVWATLGALALEGGPAFWAGLHRRHHQFSDQDGDPHSPRHHLLEGHFLWLLRPEITKGATLAAMSSRDLRAVSMDPYIKWLNHGLAQRVPWLVTLAICWLVAGLPGLVWGGIARTVFSWHATWIVNSVGHRWGKQPHATGEGSRNVWWLAPIAFGDQWHNNHHANPRAAVLTEKWWQIDPSGLVILALAKLGLVRNVRRPKNRYEERRSAA